ncbi:MAG: hypothetical protein KA110_06580, partial [Acidimicrobiia bacterium]|nr:hypothetical protein [Acidimicrobiia bacterium]
FDMRVDLVVDKRPNGAAEHFVILGPTHAWKSFGGLFDGRSLFSSQARHVATWGRAQREAK